ncbi:MAG: C_GCAxxG_C_C family protein [Spirochaetia bacterium]|nr:C_GCAxxG_C_C family protein [Spirochaetia bacterium]
MKEGNEINVYVERARLFRERGYNCAQAVACSFAQEVGLDEQTLFRVVEGLGGGMGFHKATCGAVSAAAVVVGLLSSVGVVDQDAKKVTYNRIGAIVDAFYTENKSLVCRELLGEDTQIVLRSCDGCVEDVVLSVHKMLQKIEDNF